MPRPLMKALMAHKEGQQEEKERAGDLWCDDGWVFAPYLAP